MKNNIASSDLHRFWKDELAQSDKVRVAQALENSAELRAEFESQRKLFEQLDAVRNVPARVSPDFSKQVLKKVNSWKKERLYMVRNISAIALSFMLLVSGVLVLGPKVSAQALSSALMYLEGSAGALMMLLCVPFALWAVLKKNLRLSAGFCTAALSLFFLRGFNSTFFSTKDVHIEQTGSAHLERQLPVYNDTRVSRSLEVISGMLERMADQKPADNRQRQPASAGTLSEPVQDLALGVESKDARRAATGKELVVPAFPRVFVERETSAYQPQSASVAVLSGERYGQYSENPRINVSENPVSTFAADVDTGSYSNMRRLIRQGMLPSPDAVRIEEYLNYFKYSYSNPSEGPFAVDYEIAPSPLETGRFLLKVGVKARQAQAVSDKGWNIVFLVDVSGSMDEPDKLPLLQQSLQLLARQMRPIDRIAIVSYAGAAGLRLASTSGADQANISRAITELSAGGSTNGSGGIELAYEIAKQNFIQGSVNRVVLATDGDFNVGTTSFDALMNLVEQKRRSGVTLTTLGFGQGNINEHNMEQLADQGNGNYFYIDSFREARKVLEQDMLSNFEVLAKDVKLQVEFNPTHVSQYRLIGFDNRKLNREDFTNDLKDAGEVGSGHSVTALYEITLSGSPLIPDALPALRYQDEKQAAAPVAKSDTRFQNELGILRIRYKAPDGDRSTQADFPLLSSKVSGEFKSASKDFKFAAAVAYFGQFLRQSQFARNYTLNDVNSLVQEAIAGDSDEARREFAQLVSDAKAISGQGGRALER